MAQLGEEEDERDEQNKQVDKSFNELPGLCRDKNGLLEEPHPGRACRKDLLSNCCSEKLHSSIESYTSADTVFLRKEISLIGKGFVTQYRFYWLFKIPREFAEHMICRGFQESVILNINSV